MQALLKISLSIIAAIISVLALAAITHLFSPPSNNGFSRKLLATPLALSRVERPSGLEAFAGCFNNYLYFATRKMDELYICDSQLNNFRLIKLNIPFNQKWSNNYRYFIENDTLYCWAAQVPALFKIDLETLSLIEKIELPYPYSRGVKLSPTTMIIRSSDPTDDLLDQVFIKYDNSNGISAKRHDVSPIFNDAGMGTSGQLLYSREEGMAIYVHTFSNQVVWLDSNLNIRDRTTTIDTFNHFNAKMTMIGSSKERKITFGAPPNVINIVSTTYKGFLLNYSAKRADNEGNLPNHSSIDGYALTDGTYVGTIAIPTIDREKIIDFGIVNGHILAIYKKHLALYPFGLVQGK